MICNSIFVNLLDVFRLHFPKRIFSSASWLHFYLEISSWSTPITYTLVRWVRPPHDVLKLNTDGYSKGNPGVSGEGGVLRDERGKLLLDFSCHFGLATSMQPEARALLFGVELCLQRGFGQFEVELDSLILVLFFKI